MRYLLVLLLLAGCSYQRSPITIVGVPAVVPNDSCYRSSIVIQGIAPVIPGDKDYLPR